MLLQNLGLSSTHPHHQALEASSGNVEGAVDILLSQPPDTTLQKAPSTGKRKSNVIVPSPVVPTEAESAGPSPNGNGDELSEAIALVSPTQMLAIWKSKKKKTKIIL